MTARAWTSWTASLAWGELLTSWHRDSQPDRWDRVPLDDHGDLDTIEKRVTVLVGLALHAVARTREPLTTIADPRDLQTTRLTAVTGVLAQRSKAHQLVLDEQIGPRTDPDRLGLAEVTDLSKLALPTSPAWDTPGHRSPAWDAVTTLSDRVGMWHLMEEGLRDETTTLADRLAAFETRPDQPSQRDRASVLHAAALVHDDF